MSIERDGDDIVLRYKDYYFVYNFLQKFEKTDFLNDLSEEEEKEIIDELVEFDSLNGFDTPTDTIEEWTKER